MSKQGQNKSEKEGGKTKDDKKQNQKRRKNNKTLSQKSEEGREKKLDKKAIKNGKRPESNKAHNINNLTEKDTSQW
jgi:hypothetical protein